MYSYETVNGVHMISISIHFFFFVFLIEVAHLIKILVKPLHYYSPLRQQRQIYLRTKKKRKRMYE